MNKFLIVSLLATTSLLVTGCSDDDADKGFPDKKVAAESVKAPSGKPLGKFIVSEANVEIAGEGLEYCAADAKQKIDPRFKAGQTYKVSEVQMAVNGTYFNFDIGQNVAILSVEENKLVKRTDVIFQNTTGWIEQTCSVSEQGESTSTECKLTAVSDSLKVYLERDESTNESNSESTGSALAYCYVRDFDDGPEGMTITRNRGVYSLKGYGDLEVVEVITSSSGKMSCIGKDGGGIDDVHGKIYERQLLSAALPDLQVASSCGRSSPVFTYKQAVLDDGTLVDHQQFEVLEFKK